MSHDEKHLKSSDFITDAVIGMSDGLTVPFALAAGLSGAVSSNAIILTAGVAEIVAGCIAMGLGGYLAGKTEQEHYQSELKREFEEVETVPEREMQEVMEIFADYGISQEGQTILANELAKDKTKWVGEFVHEELEFSEGMNEVDLPGHLEHYSYYNYIEHRARADKYSLLTAKKMAAAGKKANAIKPYLSAIGRFISMYIFKLGFLDGKMGFKIAQISAQSNRVKYKELRKLNRETKCL